MSDESMQRYVHEALFFGSTQELVDEAAPFLRDGLDAGSDVVLVCTDDNNRAVTEALDADERIICLRQPEVYQKPVTAIEHLRDLAHGRLSAGSEQVRIIGQLDFGASRRSWDEWSRFEALLNHVLSPFPLWSLCAYDTQSLPAPVIDAGQLAHPYVRRGGTRGTNPSYVEPAELLRRPQVGVEPLPDVEPTMVVTDLHDLRRLTRRLRDLLQAAHVGSDRVEDLVLAVNEVATNGVRHGTPPVAVRMWVEPDHVTCSITDRGPGIDDPYAGYLPGGGETLPEGRFGLWLARRLCDELVLQHAAEGFTVRLVMRPDHR
jgi:anti-sigma regulatory factor (Ser/Thr protein kinase)